MYMDTKIKIKNDFLKEIKDITKENNETILMKYNTLIKEGDDVKVGSPLYYNKKNPEALNAIRGPIFEEKVVDLILKESLITEKKVSSEDLFSEPKIEVIKSKKLTKTKVKK